MRGHRLNIFSERFRFAGLAVGPHKKFKFCCVVNFAVEYEEKDEDEIVFHDQLPPLQPDGAGEDEFYPEEYEEMQEWKGPGGFPHPPGFLPPQAKMAARGAPPGLPPKRSEVKASARPPANPLMALHKKSASTRKNGEGPKLTMQRKPSAGRKQPKCRLISVPMGSHDLDEPEAEAEVVEIKRKLTIESYSSDKEVGTGRGAPPPGDNRGTEESEEFRGGGFDFKKKKQQSNNIYMQSGAKRNEYLKTAPPRQKTLSRDKPREVKARAFKKAATSPKPYTAPQRSSSYKASKSPRRNKPYKKYTAPNQLNMKGELLRDQKVDNKQKWEEKLIKDTRAKQLMKMDDFTIPHKAINCMTKRIIRTQGNQRIKTVRKVFTMRDGTQEIHENVFVERLDDAQ